MGNQFNENETVLFQKVIEKFDADNRIAREVALFRQPGEMMQRNGDTVSRSVPMISTAVDGLDVTSKIGSITQLAVPSTLNIIKTVAWEEDALEMRDPIYRERKSQSAAQTLSASINKAMALNAMIWGSLFVRQAGASGAKLTGYDDISLADALMIENEVLGNDKTMVLNPRNYNSMAGDLAKRTLMERSVKALDGAVLGPIANFNTFVTSFGPTLLKGPTGSILVDGADQRHIPVSTSTAATGEVSNVDNRTMLFTVDGAGASTLKAGDKFTLAGVNALSHISKQDTLQLKTFTVIEQVSTTVIRIAPPIIDGSHGGAEDSEIDYANVTATPENDAELVILNTTDVQTNPFFMNDSLEIFSGNLAFGEDMAGVAVMRMTTDSGIEIIFAKQGTATTGKAFYRLTIFFGVTNLNPEMNGVLMGEQLFT